MSTLLLEGESVTAMTARQLLGALTIKAAHMYVDPSLREGTLLGNLLTLPEYPLTGECLGCLTLSASMSLRSALMRVGSCRATACVGQYVRCVPVVCLVWRC